MKLLLTLSLLLGTASAQSAQPLNANLKVTCKTCNAAVIVKQSKTKKLVRVIEFVAPVAAGAAIGFAVAPSSHPTKIPTMQFVPIHTNPAFCIIGQTC